jgi:hypothetical protein
MSISAVTFFAEKVLLTCPSPGERIWGAWFDGRGFKLEHTSGSSRCLRLSGTYRRANQAKGNRRDESCAGRAAEKEISMSAKDGHMQTDYREHRTARFPILDAAKSLSSH